MSEKKTAKRSSKKSISLSKRRKVKADESQGAPTRIEEDEEISYLASKLFPSSKSKGKGRKKEHSILKEEIGDDMADLLNDIFDENVAPNKYLDDEMGLIEEDALPDKSMAPKLEKAPKVKSRKKKVSEKKEAQAAIEGRTASYVPPPLRKKGKASVLLDNSAKELKAASIKLLNRLSEGNVTIVTKLFVDAFKSAMNADADSTPEMKREKLSKLRDELVEAFFQFSIYNEVWSVSLIAVQAAVICALSKLIDPQIGKSYYVALEKEFQKQHSQSFDSNAVETNELAKADKEICRKTLLTISLLFDFGILDISVMVKMVKQVGEALTEWNIPLLLVMLRYGGIRLRSKNPMYFKELLLLLTAKMEKLKSEPERTEELSGQLKFLMKDLDDLKNNKFNFAASERLEPLRTWLTKSPLFQSIQWTDCLLYDGTDDSGASIEAVSSTAFNNGDMGLSTMDTDSQLWILAAKHRMSSDLQKSAFVAVMGAEDDKNAIERLLKLIKSKNQIPTALSVVLYLCMYEKEYNPYYEQLLLGLCRLPKVYSKKYCRSLERVFVKQLSICGGFTIRKMRNFSMLLGRMIKQSVLSIQILRFVKFDEHLGVKGTLQEPLYSLLSFVCLESIRGMSNESKRSEIMNTFVDLFSKEDIAHHVLLHLKNMIESKDDSLQFDFTVIERDSINDVIEVMEETIKDGCT